MRKELVVFYLVALLSMGCAFQAGPINLAVGDTEASSCDSGAEVDADGAYSCNSGNSIARGSHIGDTFMDGVAAAFQAVVDGARAVASALGAGIAALGAEDTSGNA